MSFWREVGGRKLAIIEQVYDGISWELDSWRSSRATASFDEWFQFKKVDCFSWTVYQRLVSNGIQAGRLKTRIKNWKWFCKWENQWKLNEKSWRILLLLNFLHEFLRPNSIYEAQKPKIENEFIQNAFDCHFSSLPFELYSFKYFHVRRKSFLYWKRTKDRRNQGRKSRAPKVDSFVIPEQPTNNG